MIKFQLQKRNSDEVFGLFDTIQEAVVEMEKIIAKNNVESDISNRLNPFDFHLENVDIDKETINSYDDAVHYINSGEKDKIISVNQKHKDALIALNELFTIAESWNKEDNFVPDYNNRNQCKYYPWFVFDESTSNFNYALTYYTATHAHAIIGSRLCFKTSERAEKFGNQFIKLWNNVLLFQ